MQAYIARRLLALIPTLLFASIIVFVTVRLIPGDIIDMMLSQNDVSAGKMDREALVRALGLDKPIWSQYLHWVGRIVLHGDLGNSLWQTTPVTEQLRHGCRSPSSSACSRCWSACRSRCPSARIRPSAKTPPATTWRARSRS
jgi:ABC-type dipeptide/oligopeptide/nickel transport system permease component